MNFTEIKGRPCRIMWSQRDPSLRKSGVGNVFVRNLAPSVDNKGLYDTFSVFGNILSCKVATDETGASKGYGYVHFETAEAATESIQKFNGALIDDVEVSVNIFVRRQERAGQADWTNLYVKQFPVSWDVAKLKEIFEAYGVIANVAIPLDPEGKGKGIGFVNYSEHESAVKALAELANKSFEGDDATPFELYVSRAQKKNERTREIKTRIDALNQEKLSKYQGMNLYVKNISDTLSDEAFREAFAAYGTITSARIMREGNESKTSKGFGFICYSSPEEATAAVTEMNTKVVGGKPLMVNLHQRKEHRRAHLAATYAPQGMRFPGMAQNAMGMPPFMGMYMPQGQPFGQPGPRGMPGGPGVNGMSPRGGNPGMGPGGFQGRAGPGFFPGMPPYMQQGQQMPGQGMQQGQFPKGMARGPNGAGGGFGPNGPGGPGMQGVQPGLRRGNMPPNGNQMPMNNQMGGPGGVRGPGGPGGPGMPGGQNMQGRGGNQMGGYPQGMQQQQQPGVRGGPNMGQVKFNNQARNQNGQQMQMPMQGMPMQQGLPPQQMQMQQQQQMQANAAPSKLDFSDAALASADPLTQKNMIGEHLYPLIHEHQPEQAGKITGMLLEMDNGELLNLIESPDALMSKIDEALHVLRNHKSTTEDQ